ncbi:glycosyltransferase [Paenibacillus sp. PSB04]|uniref:glycosyltransferase n=1 Tax=Paenibacillus sp. PSB04 TaxID=2866810 RepID=UPI0021F1DB09|nr:glycosyltransferase [Paenibacillus sp. PSB04]UYO05156.1 glycosyltransferase [Paenibacillus sp. PSB04]
MNKINRFYNFIIVVFKILFNVDKRKVAFRKAYTIYKEFGLKGFVRAIKNKASKRDLLDGIVAKEEGEMEELPYSGSVFIPGDHTGRKLFLQQQEEFSEAIIGQVTEELKKNICFSIVLLLGRAEINMLKRSIKSIHSQFYSGWELFAVDMGAKDRRGVNFFGGEAEKDSRIHLLGLDGQKIEEAEAYNLALSRASGEYVIFMYPGDQLTPDALYWVAKSLDDGKNIDLLYSDECHVDERDNYFKFFFKPAWSPLLMVRTSYPGNLSVFRKAALQECGEFDKGFNSSALYEMTLRLSNCGGEVRHIERILYLNYAMEMTEKVRQREKSSRVKALFHHMWRMNYSASVYERDGHNFISKWRSETPLVSVIIATDHANAILGSLPQLLRDTAYPNFEIVIVANSELSENISEAIPGLGGRLVLLPYDGPLNNSKKYNLGAAAAKGEYLVFLSDNMYVAQRDWLNHLLDTLDFPGVGAVSPAVIDSEGGAIYTGGRIGQRGGELYTSTFPGQSFYNNDDRALNHHISREVSVLSKYCFSVRKEVFFQAGGLNEQDTPNRYFELDFSFRIQDNNLRCAFVSTSVLFNKVRPEMEYIYPRDRAYLYIIKQWHTFLEKDNFFTDSMLKYSSDCDRLPNRLLLPKHILKGNKGNILLISHELSRTGSPQVVFEAAKVLKDQGYFPVVASPEDGPLSRDILAEKIPVIIDQDLSKYRAYRPNEVPKSISPGIDNLLGNFDLVLVASIVSHNFINCYNGSDIPFLWWIHDGGTGYTFLENYLPRHLKGNISVYCGGRYAQEMLEKCRPQFYTEVLLYGVKDWATDMKEITDRRKKVLFLFPATFEIRKNQLLLLEAIGMLPEAIAEKADFLLIGKAGDELYYRSVDNKASELPNVKISGPVPYDELMNIYRETACVVVPSIDDPMPVVLAEAMMMSKIVLCSDMTGTARYIEDGVNGFLFSSRNASELKEKLEYVIDNFDAMDDVRKAGRKTYEQYFSQEIFTENLVSVVEKNIIRFTEDSK